MIKNHRIKLFLLLFQVTSTASSSTISEVSIKNTAANISVAPTSLQQKLVASNAAVTPSATTAATPATQISQQVKMESVKITAGLC